MAFCNALAHWKLGAGELLPLSRHLCYSYGLNRQFDRNILLTGPDVQFLSPHILSLVNLCVVTHNVIHFARYECRVRIISNATQLSGYTGHSPSHIRSLTASESLRELPSRHLYRFSAMRQFVVPSLIFV